MGHFVMSRLRYRYINLEVIIHRYCCLKIGLICCNGNNNYVVKKVSNVRFISNHRQFQVIFHWILIIAFIKAIFLERWWNICLQEEDLATGAILKIHDRYFCRKPTLTSFVLFSMIIILTTWSYKPGFHISFLREFWSEKEQTVYLLYFFNFCLLTLDH